MIIAFDVDDTLIVPAVATGLDRDTPNYENIAAYKWFQAQGHTMWIWSGGGADYARTWANKLGLTADLILAKTTEHKNIVDISIDDCIVDLARVNLRVRRINNQRKRQ